MFFKDKKIIFRLKRLQVVDILTNQWIFSKANFSIPADDFLEVLNEFMKGFGNWKSILFNWVFHRQYYISEIITPWGLCFTFNIAPSNDLLNKNSTSDDFHYEEAWTDYENIPGRLSSPIKSPRAIDTSKAGLWVGFWELENEKKILDQPETVPLNGHIVLIHDPFELPSRNSKMVKYSLELQTRILIDPQLNSIDESLYGYEPAE